MCLEYDFLGRSGGGGQWQLTIIQPCAHMCTSRIALRHSL
jgi:hypothetical protein